MVINRKDPYLTDFAGHLERQVGRGYEQGRVFQLSDKYVTLGGEVLKSRQQYKHLDSRCRHPGRCRRGSLGHR